MKIGQAKKAKKGQKLKKIRHLYGIHIITKNHLDLA